MLKLKLALDTSNAAQLRALSKFADELAEAANGTEKPALVAASSSSGLVDPEKSEYVKAPSVEEIQEETPEKPKASKAEDAPEEEKPKRRKRRTKAELEAAKQGDDAEEESAESEDAGEEAESEEAEEQKPAKASNVTLDDIRRAVAEKKEKHFQIMKFKLKEDYGVGKTTDLDEKDYADFFNFVNGL